MALYTDSSRIEPLILRVYLDTCPGGRDRGSVESIQTMLQVRVEILDPIID